MLCLLVSQIDINTNTSTSKMFITGKGLIFIYELLQSNPGVISANALIHVAGGILFVERFTAFQLY